jgi:hypothetical protein
MVGTNEHDIDAREILLAHDSPFMHNGDRAVGSLKNRHPKSYPGESDEAFRTAAEELCQAVPL